MLVARFLTEGISAVAHGPGLAPLDALPNGAIAEGDAAVRSGRKFQDVMQKGDGETELPKYGSDWSRRKFDIPDLAKRFLLEHQGLFSLAFPACVRCGPNGASTHWKRICEEVLPKLEKSGWTLTAAFVAMRDGACRGLRRVGALGAQPCPLLYACAVIFADATRRPTAVARGCEVAGLQREGGG